MEDWITKESFTLMLIKSQAVHFALPALQLSNFLTDVQKGLKQVNA